MKQYNGESWAATVLLVRDSQYKCLNKSRDRSHLGLNQ